MGTERCKLLVLYMASKEAGFIKMHFQMHLKIFTSVAPLMEDLSVYCASNVRLLFLCNNIWVPYFFFLLENDSTTYSKSAPNI